MRALAYFQTDSNVTPDDLMSETMLVRRFRAYCKAKQHSDLGAFSDDAAGTERLGFREMIDYIRTSG